MLLAHPLGMAHSLVAAPANGYQVPLLGSVFVGKVPTKREMGELFDVLDMMHKLRRIGSAADLAVPVIVP